MFLHPQHVFPHPAEALALVREHPLGAWVCATPGGLVANHLPFLLDESAPDGVLRLQGHVSRANPVWRQLGAGCASVVMFQGPQAYITPGWYPGHAAHGRVVPTWNYAVAHAHGVARVLDTPEALLRIVQSLTARHEAAVARPWDLSDAPAGFIDGLLRAVIGIEITVERVESRLKASQDEERADRQGTVHGLRERGGAEDAAMADWVQRALDSDAEGAP